MVPLTEAQKADNIAAMSVVILHSTSVLGYKILQYFSTWLHRYNGTSILADLTCAYL